MVFVTFVLGGLLVAAAYTDIRRRQIPNGLVGIGLCAFFIMALTLYAQGSTDYLLGCVKAGVLAFVLHMIPYLRRAMGAGDVKLALVIGLLLGWQGWLGYLAAFSAVSLVVVGALFLFKILGAEKPKTIPMAPLMAAAFFLQTLLSVFTPIRL